MSIALRAWFRRPGARREAKPDNRLTFFDQAAFASLRATGRQQLIQGVWVYEHPIDLEGVRRFHRDFGYGLWGRLIERSPLPFGRHRWVSSTGPASELAIGEAVRPREQLTDWVDEHVRQPIDPESGPGWHLAVQPFADGSTAVSLLVSHCLGDGIGSMVSVVEAVLGNRPDFGHPPIRSRNRVRAVLGDAIETMCGAPELARALAVTAKLLRARRHDLTRAAKSRPRATMARVDGVDGGEDVTLPCVQVYVAIEDWDARAESLGGNGHSLAVGFAAKIAQRIGRRRPDGTVQLLIAVNDRTVGDSRAHAMRICNTSVDPAAVTKDLSVVRADVREAIGAVRAAPDESLRILPLIPFMPKKVMVRLTDVFVGAADLPVSCSNIGDLPVEIARLDGTDAEYCFHRGVDQRVTRDDLDRSQGQLVVITSRSGGRIGINILAYQPGAANSKPWLRDIATDTLDEFHLASMVL